MCLGTTDGESKRNSKLKIIMHKLNANKALYLVKFPPHNVHDSFSNANPRMIEPPVLPIIVPRLWNVDIIAVAISLFFGRASASISVEVRHSKNDAPMPCK